MLPARYDDDDDDIDILSLINNHVYTIFFYKEVIFFSAKDNGILLFLVEKYTIKTDIIIHYCSLPNSTALKLCS